MSGVGFVPLAIRLIPEQDNHSGVRAKGHDVTAGAGPANLLEAQNRKR